MNEKIYEYSADALAGKTKVIYGCFLKAREFAVRLLCEEISFDMFLFPEKNENYFLPHILNKPVIDVNQCLELHDVAILVSLWEYEEAKERLEQYGLINFLVKVEDLASSIRKSKNVIVYGTGGRAKRFYHDIKSVLVVQNFCDSNEKRRGDKFFGKEILSPSDLLSCPKGTVVIIASTYIEEIQNIVLENGITEDYIFAVRYESELNLRKKEFDCIDCRDLKIKEYDLHAIVRDTKDKRVVIYGYRGVVEAILPKLKILGIYPEEIVLRNVLEEDGTVYNLSFIYSENTIILLTDLYSQEMHTALVEMEVTEKDMVWIWGHSSFHVSNKCEVVLDPNCGYTYVAEEEEFPAFITYSYKNPKSNKESIRILTLGGSTTSAYSAKNSSWSQKLSLLLKEQGISHVLYCGGIDAYSTSNELIKLIRDGIWLRPDLVINYTGCNNENRPQYENLFLNTYQEILFKSLAGKAEIEFAGKMNQVYYGIRPEVSEYEYWHTQVKALHGVCTSLGIRHKVFLQPLLFNKNTFFESDADVAVLWNVLFDKKIGRYVGVNAPSSHMAVLQNVEVFEEAGKRFQDTWLESLTDIFDEEDNIYMDYCHVYEKGNQIIAEEIYERIKEELLIILDEIEEGE